jgi:hypothetical protein
MWAAEVSYVVSSSKILVAVELYFLDDFDQRR